MNITKKHSHLFKTILLCALLAQGSSLNTALANNSAAAEALFDQGKEKMKAGDLEQACQSFEKSQRLEPSVGTLLNLGECQVKRGKTASAWSTFKQASSLASKEGDTRRGEYADQRADAIKPLLTQLLVQKHNAQKSLELTILRDDVDMTILLDTVIPVDPGKYTFKVSANGYETKTFTHSVAGEGKTVELSLPLLIDENEAKAIRAANLKLKNEELNAPKAAQLKTNGNPGQKGSKKKLIAYSMGGLGVASIGAGIFFGLRAKSKNDESLLNCDNNVCSQLGLDLNSEAKSAANLSTVLTGVGGALLLTGGVIWYLDKKNSNKERNSLTVAPSLTSDLFQVSLLGKF